MKLCIILTFIYITSTYGKQLPSYVQKCKKDDPEIDKCMTTQILAFMPHLLESGVPSMKLPKIEPLVVLKLQADTAGFNTTMTNNKIYGLIDVQIQSFALNMAETELQMNLFYSTLKIESDYQFSGKIVAFPLTSSGRFILNVSNVHIDMHLMGSTVLRKKQMYFNFVNVKTNVSMAPPAFYFYDLFKGNPALTENTNKILNEDKSISQLVSSIIKTAASKVITNALTSIFDDFSVDELLD